MYNHPGKFDCFAVVVTVLRLTGRSEKVLWGFQIFIPRLPNTLWGGIWTPKQKHTWNTFSGGIWKTRVYRQNQGKIPGFSSSHHLGALDPWQWPFMPRLGVLNGWFSVFVGILALFGQILGAPNGKNVEVAKWSESVTFWGLHPED